jgi:hypothetical protein
MTKKSNNGKSQKESLAKAVKQMDSWMQNDTNLNLLMNAPLLMLSGRLVGRHGGVFLFDAHCGSCRAPLVPDNYACSLSSYKGSSTLTLKDDFAGELTLSEDLRGKEHGSEEKSA